MTLHVVKGVVNMVNTKKSTGWLIGAVCLAICSILYVVSAAVFSSGDWVRLGLSVVAAIGFAIAAFGFYTQWSKEKSKEH